MAKISMLRRTLSRSSARERRPGRLSTSRAASDWPGPHLARMDAWIERRQRILTEIAQCADSGMMLDRWLDGARARHPIRTRTKPQSATPPAVPLSSLRSF